VMMAIVDACGVPVRLITMGRISTSVPGHWFHRALSRGVFTAYDLCGYCQCGTSTRQIGSY
jgi:hypothetical protein